MRVEISISLLLLLPLLNNTDQTLEKTEQFKEGLKNTIFFTLAEKNYILLVLLQYYLVLVFNY